MKILPIGEPILETCRPWLSMISFARPSWSSSRSRTFVPQALRNSRYDIPSLLTSAHCSSRSGDISSENPERVHMRMLLTEACSLVMISNLGGNDGGVDKL